MWIRRNIKRLGHIECQVDGRQTYIFINEIVKRIVHFLVNPVGVIAASLYANHRKTLMHANDVNKDIHTVKVDKHKLRNAVVSGSVIGASRKTLDCEGKKSFI